MKIIIKTFTFMFLLGVLFVNSKSLITTENNSNLSLNLSNLELIQVASAESSGDVTTVITRTTSESTIIFKKDSNGNYELDENNETIPIGTSTTITTYQEDIDNDTGEAVSEEYAGVVTTTNEYF